MASQALGGTDGTTNGTTPVTVIPAPVGTKQHANKLITICNVDTVNAVAVLSKVSAGGTRVLQTINLYPGDTHIFDEVLNLTATTDSVELVLLGAVTTSEPIWTSSWIENTP